MIALPSWARPDRHSRSIRIAAILVMFIPAARRMRYELLRLLTSSKRGGAIDLRQRYAEVHHWFAGEPVYSQLKTAVYPPASYAILWPLVGWSSLPVARWFWAVTSVLAVLWL